jgi:hypothetical protein
LSSFACDQAEASAALSRSGKLAIASPSSCPRLRRQALSGADCTFDQAKFRKYIHNPDTNIAPNSQTEGKTTRLWTETRLVSIHKVAIFRHLALSLEYIDMPVDVISRRTTVISP